MKKYFYLLVIVLTINIVNRSNSQTFPDINNDTTYLRQITVEEGAKADMPIYMDTTGLNGFNGGMIAGGGNKERYYSKYGIMIHFHGKYFFNNKPNTDSLNYNTENIELIELFDSLKNRYGNFDFADIYETGSDTLKGRELYFIFDNHVNSISVYEFLLSNISNSLRYAGYDHFPAKPVSSIEKNINNLNLFPNPSSDYISLDLGGLEVADLSIYDMIGNKIMTIPNYSNKTEIDVSNLIIGTYFLNFNFQTYKFIKE